MVISELLKYLIIHVLKDHRKAGGDCRGEEYGASSMSFIQGLGNWVSYKIRVTSFQPQALP